MHSNLIKLLIENPPFMIINSELEGECKVKNLIPLRLSSSKLFLFVLLSVLTIGLLPLFVKWFPKLRLVFLYETCVLSSSTHIFVENSDNHVSVQNIERSSLNEPFFFNRHLKYTFNPELNSFEPANFDFNMSYSALLQNFCKKSLGDSSFHNFSSVNHRDEKFGKCLISIPIPSCLSYMASELSNPFYILQYFSCLIWIFEGAFYFAIILIAVSVSLSFLNYIFLRLAKQKLRKLAEIHFQVNIFR